MKSLFPCWLAEPALRGYGLMFGLEDQLGGVPGPGVPYG